ncbi:MAG TPA: hypothetical protein VHE81_21240 [Lacipirellulaceae bacterium]|nr:hypothetical protein [Lacipirellulaceae bacterium]
MNRHASHRLPMTQNNSQEVRLQHDALQRSVEELLAIGHQYFLPEAVELLRRTRDKKRLSDDEILLLTITAAQAARAHYAEPGNRSAKDTLDTILHVLDHEDVIRAEYNKLYSIFRGMA